MTHRNAKHRLRGTCGLAPTLLPVLKCPSRNTQENCELLLRQAYARPCLGGFRQFDFCDSCCLAAMHLIDRLKQSAKSRRLEQELNFDRFIWKLDCTAGGSVKYACI